MAIHSDKKWAQLAEEHVVNHQDSTELDSLSDAKNLAFDSTLLARHSAFKVSMSGASSIAPNTGTYSELIEHINHSIEMLTSTLRKLPLDDVNKSNYRKGVLELSTETQEALNGLVRNTFTSTKIV